MASLIKNQILKHLSKFTKNLSPDKINVSTLKGEGELTNLELNEEVLTELLELPNWMRLTKATCNRVSIRVSWTKLKNLPIYLLLDEVRVEMTTVENLRPVATHSQMPSYSSGGRYGFIDKVIDGMTLSVNNVILTFRSPAFQASVQLSRVHLESRSPNWAKCNLRMSRLKDSDRGEILVFKELEWQTLKVEATSTQDVTLSPLRLITNQARTRITIKKRLQDCFVIGCRLVLIIDDLLWVLTDAQLTAALHFLQSLSSLVELTTKQNHEKKAERKLETLPEYQAGLSQSRSRATNTPLGRVFSMYDVVETSYHFYSNQLTFHLCDDRKDCRSTHPELRNGGALQMTLSQLQLDYYPYHLAGGSRKHWVRYQDTAAGGPAQWQEASLTSFRNTLLDILQGGKKHTPLARAPPHGLSPPGQGKGPPSPESPVHASPSPRKSHALTIFHKLMAACVILRIADFCVYRLTTSKRKEASKEFLAGDKERCQLPEKTYRVHIEFIQYYYPGDCNFPMPPPKLWIQLNPVQLTVDSLTILWLNAFMLNLEQNLNKDENNKPYIDVHLEALMPRLIFESPTDMPNQRDRPKSLHVQTSRLVVSNHRWGGYGCLARCLDELQRGELFFGSSFPSQTGDIQIVHEKFLKHATGADDLRKLPTGVPDNPEALLSLKKESLWTDSNDVWFVHLEPVWADFWGARTQPNRPITFIDAIPVQLWVYQNNPTKIRQARRDTLVGNLHGDVTSPQVNSPVTTEADFHILAYVTSLVSLQINHFQYLFLLRLAETLNELSTMLAKDTANIEKCEYMASLCVGGYFPQVDVSLVMPSQSQEKNSSGCDLDSVIPDSSSITDLHSETPLDFRMRESVSDGFGRKFDSRTGSLVKSQSDNGLSESESTQNLDVFDCPPAPTATAPANGVPSNISFRNSPSRDDPSRRRSTLSMQNGPIPQLNLPENLNVGLTTMKKGLSSGLSNLMSSLDSALKHSPEDISDTVSIQSDLSSDSDTFVMVHMEGERDVASPGEALFQTFKSKMKLRRASEDADSLISFTGANEFAEVKIPHPLPATIEMADEVQEDSPSDMSGASSIKRKDVISVATLKLGQVQVIQQSIGLHSTIKLQCSHLIIDECSAIAWDEFQTKFATRARGWHDASADPSSACSISIRHDQTFEEVEGSPSTPQLMLKGKVQGLNLSLLMSTVTGLVSLTEDEILPEPLPFEMILEKVDLKMTDDRPPSSVTSPCSPPVQLSIPSVVISRDVAGKICILPTTSDTSWQRLSMSTLMATSHCSQDDGLFFKKESALVESLREENESLKKKVEQLEELQSRLLERVEQSEGLRKRVAELGEEVECREAEKRSLLQTLQRFQVPFRR